MRVCENEICLQRRRGKKEKRKHEELKERRREDLSEGENDERYKVIAYKNSLGTRTTKSEKEIIERVNKQIRSSRES
jgi:hypothetical protein